MSEKPTVDQRLERLVERHEALVETMELLRGSVSDLTAIVHAETKNLREQRERDRQYFLALSDLLRSWGGENGKP
jgi:hypothetical protein